MPPKRGQNNKKKGSAAPTPIASGAATPIPVPKAKIVPTVIGINFGQCYTSIAVINKEGLADCIANDDGDRQLASAISFNGEEEYFGNPAKVQLIRNHKNTIMAFRNLLGKSFSQVSSVKQPWDSAPIVNQNDSPAFTVSINDTPTTLDVQSVASRYLKTVISYATDFLGRPVTHAVLAVPADFETAQIEALTKAAEGAGVKVLQVIPEDVAAINAHQSIEAKNAAKDRNVVVLDVGAASTTVSVISLRSGLAVPISSASAPIGGNDLDASLSSFFAKEFTKKTKVPISPSDHRANMKLQLSVEITKKSLSASNSATCSVESLAEGADFFTSINRMRFDLLAASTYTAIADKIRETLASSSLDAVQIDQVLLVGGTTKLPKLSDKLAEIFPESTVLTSSIEPDEIIAKGCAIQAQSLLTTFDPEDSKAQEKLQQSLKEINPASTSKPIGFVIPETKEFITLVDENTPLPVRRIAELALPEGASGSVDLLLSLWEGCYSIKVEKEAVEQDPEDSEPEEPEEIKTLVSTAEKALIDLRVTADASVASGIRASIVIDKSGKATVVAAPISKGGKVVGDEVEGAF